MKNTMYVIGKNEKGELALNNTYVVEQLTKHNKIGIKNIICGHKFNIFIDYHIVLDFGFVSRSGKYDPICQSHETLC